jgi:hypothetical protein
LSFDDDDDGHHLIIEKETSFAPCGILTAVKARTAIADVIDKETMPFVLTNIIVVKAEKKTFASVYLSVIQ